MSLDEQLSNIKQALLDEIDKSKNIIFKGLLENPLINRIPESLFVNYFLPCFIGRSNNPNWVMEWISIAGTPMAEVIVFKDGTNEDLFKVPGLLYTNNLFMHKKEGDLGDIFGRYEQINNNTPTTGLAFLLEALNSKNDELMSNYNMNEVNRAWLEIFQRYGLISSDETISNEAKQESNLNDFLEF